MQKLVGAVQKYVRLDMNLVLCTMDAEGDHVLNLHRGSGGY